MWRWIARELSPQQSGLDVVDIHEYCRRLYRLDFSLLKIQKNELDSDRNFLQFSGCFLFRFLFILEILFLVWPSRSLNLLSQLF